MNRVYKKIYYGFIIAGLLFSVSFLISGIQRDTTLRVIFLDVGQGDATLIITPRGRTVLIDAGKYPGLGKSLSRYIPLSDRDIDMVIGTHPDLDHIGGLDSIFQEYAVDIFLHSGYVEDSLVYRNLIHDISDTTTRTATAQAGQRFTLDTGIYLDILSPYPSITFEEKNEHSVIVRLVYGEHQFLLTGDASIHNEQQLMDVYGQDILHSDVLKIGHHGSQTSTAESFVDMVAPTYAVISAGCDNAFGHPHQEVLNRLFARQIIIEETCRSGDIVFHSNGIHLTTE
jgi:competence protein ComEC